MLMLMPKEDREGEKGEKAPTRFSACVKPSDSLVFKATCPISVATGQLSMAR